MVLVPETEINKFLDSFDSNLTSYDFPQLLEWGSFEELNYWDGENPKRFYQVNVKDIEMYIRIYKQGDEDE